jgi:hypothetical protein
MLKSGHGDVKPDAESFERIATWIDLNAPYYPSHVTYYSNNTVGRSPLGHKDLARLGTLVLGSPKGKQYGWNRVNEYTCGQIGRLMGAYGPPVSFTRPEMSLCLKGFGNKSHPAYVEALSLIRKGKATLEAHPRADMPGFRPSPADQARLDHLAMRQGVEQRNRAAIVNGAKLYDKP